MGQLLFRGAAPRGSGCGGVAGFCGGVAVLPLAEPIGVALVAGGAGLVEALNGQASLLLSPGAEEVPDAGFAVDDDGRFDGGVVREEAVGGLVGVVTGEDQGPIAAAQLQVVGCCGDVLGLSWVLAGF